MDVELAKALGLDPMTATRDSMIARARELSRRDRILTAMHRVIQRTVGMATAATLGNVEIDADVDGKVVSVRLVPSD